MLRARPAVSATIVAVALATTVTACGSIAHFIASKPASGPLHGLTGAQIEDHAMANTKAAADVQISGKAYGSSKIAMDLLLEKDKGCTGTISEGKTGSLQLLTKDGTAWVKPDMQFLSQATSDPSSITLLKGKYIKVKAGGNGIGSLASLCSISAFLGNSTSPNPNALSGKISTITYHGQRVVKIVDGGDSGYMYVSDTAKPLLVLVNAPGSSGGIFNFSYPAKPSAITTPSASEVIDGSKYGF